MMMMMIMLSSWSVSVCSLMALMTLQNCCLTSVLLQIPPALASVAAAIPMIFSLFSHRTLLPHVFTHEQAAAGHFTCDKRQTFNASPLTSQVKWTRGCGKVTIWQSCILTHVNGPETDCAGANSFCLKCSYCISHQTVDGPCWLHIYTCCVKISVYDTSLYVLWMCANESLADVWKPFVSVPALFICVNLFVVSSEHFVRMDVVTCTSELRFSYRRVCWHSANSSVHVA